MVPVPTKSNTFSQHYTLMDIYSPCCEDVVFELLENTHINYINRGLEKGIDLNEWNNSYKGQKLIFTFIKHKPLIGRKLRSIAKIEFKNQIIYNAIS